MRPRVGDGHNPWFSSHPSPVVLQLLQQLVLLVLHAASEAAGRVVAKQSGHDPHALVRLEQGEDLEVAVNTVLVRSRDRGVAKATPRQPGDPSHCTWGVERRREFGTLGPGAAVSWPWVVAWGSLEPPRRDGKNAQKRGKTGGKWPRYGLKRVNKERTGGINWISRELGVPK